MQVSIMNNIRYNVKLYRQYLIITESIVLRAPPCIISDPNLKIFRKHLLFKEGRSTGKTVIHFLIVILITF